MKLFTLLFTIVSLCFCGEIKTAEFNVNGMFCANGCANKIKTAVKAINGVENCNVDYNTSSMTVQFDSDKVNDSQIMAELTKSTTYKYSEKNTKCASKCSSAKCASENCCKNTKEKQKKGFFSKIFNW